MMIETYFQLQKIYNICTFYRYYIFLNAACELKCEILIFTRIHSNVTYLIECCHVSKNNFTKWH